MDKLIGCVQILPNLVAMQPMLCPKLKENTESLKRKIELLESRKEDIDVKLSRSVKNCRKEVEKWMENVEYIKKEFETLEQVQQSSRFYHVFKRQKLVGQLERMNEEVTELDRRDFSSGLFQEVDERAGPLLLTSQPIGQAQNFDDVWTSLMDDGILSIGIYGMGGVGKTTLAKRVHDELLKESTFSGHVYWVTVSQEFNISKFSQEFNISKLQSDIARELEIDITCENDEVKRAARLLQAFKKKERFVLILDDVWQRIDAKMMGIPSKRECKLVITSRSEEVCHGTRCKKIIKVNTLSKQEALDLFLKTLDCGEPSLEVKEICNKMVNRCDGLPLALITLAGSMRGVDDFREWRDAWEGLKESCLGRANMEGVLPILLYSYNRLGDPRLKRCFLYCSLYPEDFRFSREELIGHFISEGLMERRLSWQAEVDQGHAILNQLVRACLLESDSDLYLKMHDLIREMAIGITQDTPRYMVKAGLHLKELPEEQEWTEDLDKVSLMDNFIEEISPGTSPKCPSLSTLILRRNPLRLIPDCFFTHMRGLRTLDLSETKIKSLPNSISDLEKLNVLLLRCPYTLSSVPSLEKLKELRHLDLTDTFIGEVPQGMESLTNLKRLYLRCSWLKMIPMGTLHRLTHLQQLVLPYHLDVPIEEVETLKQLEVFQCRLNSVSDLNRLINSRQIDKPLDFYDIIIASRENCTGIMHSLPCKRLRFKKDSLVESSLETMLPRNIEDLLFESSGLSGCLLDEFPFLNSVGDLKECRIKEEDKIECIMRLEEERQSSTRVPFQSLEVLALSGLPNLIGLFKWEAVAAPLPPGTFSCLKKLNICGCDKIKKLFPQSAVHNFRNLESLNVTNCVQMEEIIEEEQSSTGVPFQSLEDLTLGDLPNLIGLFKWEAVAAPLSPDTFSCLKELNIYGCAQIKKLFPQSAVHNFRNLESLDVRKCVQMEEIIEDDNNEGADIKLPRFQSLSLHDLPQLKSICKGKMICDSIKYISLDGIKNVKELDSQFLFLVHNLHNLRSLTVMNYVPTEELIEEQQSSTGVPFQSLEHMELSGLPNLIGLFKWEAVAAPLPPGTFSYLESLSIYKCGKIKKLFPRSAAHNFHNLKRLCVEKCVQMEEIIEDDNDEGADIKLPRCQSLSLLNLPQLKSICKVKMICDSIEVISLSGIKNIKEVPLYLPLLDGQLSHPPRLQSIGLHREDEEWWESLDWPHHNAKNVLQPLINFVDDFITDSDASESGEEESQLFLEDFITDSDASESGEEESQC